MSALDNSGHFWDHRKFLERKDIFHRKFIDFTIGGHYNCDDDI